MKRLVIGLCAHVDAGKTTLSEELLFSSGMIRKKGRVDNGDTLLDTSEIEKARGITVFSHQAVLETDDCRITLLDTPGHADFAARAEQCLSVLDAAILLISAPEGVQSHTRVLWRLLKDYNVPVIIFVNKTDLLKVPAEQVLESITREFGNGVCDISGDMYESCAASDEDLLECYLSDELTDGMIAEAIVQRRIFPLIWGSALKGENVDKLTDIITNFIPQREYSNTFGARVFKVTSENGAALAHIKVTGGTVNVRDDINGQKVSQIRVYSGDKYTVVQTLFPGDIGTLVGINVRSGAGLGAETDLDSMKLSPVMSFSVKDECDDHTLFERLKALESSIPTLAAAADDEITVNVMGDMELEVLSALYEKEYGSRLTFGARRIRYKETIKGSVIGMGHYEPLRHYAEAIVRIEEGAHGSGIVFGTDCPEDILSSSKQRSFLSALESKVHKGVLIGAPLTDVKITLISGRTHIKHTEGGDIFQAVSRAVRQGLMNAENVILEPWYDFVLTVPAEYLGRAMTDLDKMGAVTAAPEIAENARICGYAPVSALWHYHSDVRNYTKGQGELEQIYKGYYPALSPESIISDTGYDAEADLANSPDSIFCIKGAGMAVRWDVAPEHMHSSAEKEKPSELPEITPAQIARFKARLYSDEELMAVFEKTYGKIDRPARNAMRREPEIKKTRPHPLPNGPDYLLVDGYNVIFAWDELKKLANHDLDHARHSLRERLINFAAIKEYELILVFDAYKVKGAVREIDFSDGITTVYTKEAETADMYIERTSHEIKNARRVRVATSDYAEQLIILGNGALRISAKELQDEIKAAEQTIADMIAKIGDR